MDISVILPVVNESENLRVLIPRLTALLDRERITHEVIVVDGGSTDGTQAMALSCGARVVKERRRGYAGALETGFAFEERIVTTQVPAGGPGAADSGAAGGHAADG